MTDLAFRTGKFADSQPRPAPAGADPALAPPFALVPHRTYIGAPPAADRPAEDRP